MEVSLQVRNTRTSCLGSRVEVSGGLGQGLASYVGQHSRGFPGFGHIWGWRCPPQFSRCNPFTVILQGRHNEPRDLYSKIQFELTGFVFTMGRTCDLAPRVNAGASVLLCWENLGGGGCLLLLLSDCPLGICSGLDCSFLSCSEVQTVLKFRS